MNLPLLALMLGVGVEALREPKVAVVVEAAVGRGQVVVGGLCEITAVRCADGGERPWIDGIDPAVLGPLTHFCRMCAVVFVYMFSGMRDSEVQSLRKGCVEEFWGHLTLTGKEFKTFRGGQARWVVIEPVAHAARIAEALSWHPERIVVTARPGTDPVIDAGAEIDSLIATMNVAADLGLLEPIPDGDPIRPHRFRRTFAITARKYPWMQIALNWQFKHASHFMTQSYYALNDDVTVSRPATVNMCMRFTTSASLSRSPKEGISASGSTSSGSTIQRRSVAASCFFPACERSGPSVPPSPSITWHPMQ